MLRELCLRLFVNILVLILCQKTGNVFLIFLNIFSRFYRKQTKTYLKNLRHSSLGSNIFIIYVKFHVCNLHNKRDIHVQKIKVQKLILEFIPYCLTDSTVDSYEIYIIKKVPYSVLSGLNGTYLYSVFIL